MIPAFKKINTGDFITNSIQDNVDQSFNNITKSEIIDGILLTGISLTSGADNMVEHKLGRNPIFWMLARQNTNTTVWETTANTNASFLALRCGSNCTVSLWVG